MAVIGIGTTSRATPADVLAIIAAAKAMMTQESLEKSPSPQPSPARGEGVGHARCAGVPFSARGEGMLFSPLPWRERGRGEGGPIKALAALDRPALNPVLSEASLLAGLDLVLLTLGELRAAAPFCVTHSEKSMQRYGIPSVAEAAALAAAGAGARLLLPRIRGQNATASVAILP